jgi:pimeloyl-ACP methyl ester carboxylesterase
MSAPSRPPPAPTGDTQATAQNLTLEAANGVDHACRRFGNAGAEMPPLVFLQHFRRNLDNWDPLLVDSLAPGREVVLLGDHLPNARVRIFPDAGHGFLFQWPVEFANVVTTFLES